MFGRNKGGLVLNNYKVYRHISLREAARIYKVSTATIYNWIRNPKNKEWSYEK